MNHEVRPDLIHFHTMLGRVKFNLKFNSITYMDIDPDTPLKCQINR